jgi:hypothetical protein
MALQWPPKDPAEVLDYSMDWKARLATDTISTSTWTVPSGITKNTDSFAATATTIWLSAGVLGKTYILTNTIVTAGGRTMDQSVALTMVKK